MPDDTNCYVGIDVGTGSVRALLVDRTGAVLGGAERPTQTFRAPHDPRVFEQSTADIWAATAAAVRGALADARVAPERVRGVGFDATCSLAVTDPDGEPVVVTEGAQLGQCGARNVVLWADHRAEDEARLINETGSVVLDYVGGTMSLEMEIPKILWLKNRMPPALFARCQFFDLPDYLTYRATGARTRSACSLTCKCSFLPDTETGWQRAFFAQIGLGALADAGYTQIGTPGDVLTAGRPVGAGLSARAAGELGLRPGTPVGSAVIDAYAGWIGTVAARHVVDGVPAPAPALADSRHRLAAVAGTSTCHLVQSPEGVSVNGVWGPYKDAVCTGWWMNEGGQSSTGQLIEFILTTHPAYKELVEQADKEKTTIYAVLDEILEKLRTEAGVETLTELTKDMHFYPDLHGNRSPIADPRMRGSITGLALDAGPADLARKYHLALEAIALQTRHILAALNGAGHAVRALHVSGGQARNAQLMRLLAAACAVPAVLPAAPARAVPLGAAVLARVAAEAAGPPEAQGAALWAIMVEMTPPGTLVAPAATPKEKRLLDAKYKIFLESIEIQKRWRQQMDAAAA